MPLSGGWTSFARSLMSVYGRVIGATPLGGESGSFYRSDCHCPRPAPDGRAGQEQAVSDTTTAENRCQGVLVGLAADDQIGGPIRMGLGLDKSLPGTRQIFSEKISLRARGLGDWDIFFTKICRP